MFRFKIGGWTGLGGFKRYIRQGCKLGRKIGIVCVV